MNWLDDMEQALRFKEQERGQHDARQYQWMLAMQEQGPLFFASLKQTLHDACKRPSFSVLNLSEGTDRSFSLSGDPDSRPIMRVRAHLSGVGLILSVEESSASVSPSYQKASRSIEFGVDGHGKLSLCMECRPMTLEDVAELILRYAVGLK